MDLPIKGLRGEIPRGGQWHVRAQPGEGTDHVEVRANRNSEIAVPTARNRSRYQHVGRRSGLRESGHRVVELHDLEMGEARAHPAVQPLGLDPCLLLFAFLRREELAELDPVGRKVLVVAVEHREVRQWLQDDSILEEILIEERFGNDRRRRGHYRGLVEGD